MERAQRERAIRSEMEPPDFPVWTKRGRGTLRTARGFFQHGTNREAVLSLFLIGKIPKGRRRQVQPSTKVTGEGHPKLIDFVGVDDPDITSIRVVLAPFELLTGPRQVSCACSTGVGSGSLEITEG